MDFSNELSLEQEFKLAIYYEKINKLNQIQSQKYLIDILKQMMTIDNIIKHMVKNSSL
uniref:phycytochrome bilisome degradation protein n=1 Tax=Pseudoerythrocladia kornmannii TaxID=753682 RepID=UPI001BEEE5B6|nr:phycytochrome bilisome degradation protein [Pseudoerythrocladia kornmannii]QUE28253.1 nblA [Pseudoerythrocladia kornmannii]UNJ16757.1 phycytochrome bilisome degradation protein [Pseudoerythrocladia kornmannii]